MCVYLRAGENARRWLHAIKKQRREERAAFKKRGRVEFEPASKSIRLQPVRHFSLSLFLLPTRFISAETKTLLSSPPRRLPLKKRAGRKSKSASGHSSDTDGIGILDICVRASGRGRLLGLASKTRENKWKSENRRSTVRSLAISPPSSGRCRNVSRRRFSILSE